MVTYSATHSASSTALVCFVVFNIAAGSKLRATGLVYNNEEDSVVSIAAPDHAALKRETTSGNAA